MQLIVCELCGSNDVIKQNSVFVCQHCGTKYSVEEARKLIGAVSIDRTRETENLLILARRAKDENNDENAARYYDMVLQNDPNNWEACFYMVYFQSMGCKIYQISEAARAVANNISGTVSLIQEYEQPEKQKAALSEIIARSAAIAHMLTQSAINHYLRSSGEGALSECYQRLCAIVGIFQKLEASIKNDYGSKHDCVLAAQKEYLGFSSANARWLKKKNDRKERTRLTNEIKQIEPDYTVPQVTPSGCYIATCVYGSYDSPPVWTLRRYRDNVLAESWYGRAFIRVYYAISPKLVGWFGSSSWFKAVWQKHLDKLVADLQNKGFACTPYKDKNWQRNHRPHS